MKNYKFILLAAVTCVALSSCGGDHATGNGGDSVMVDPNYDVKSNIDTSTVTHATGEATMVENAASGGVLVAKDSTHMKVRSVTITPTSAPVAAPAKADSAAVTKK